MGTGVSFRLSWANASLVQLYTTSIARLQIRPVNENASACLDSDVVFHLHSIAFSETVNSLEIFWGTSLIHEDWERINIKNFSALALEGGSQDRTTLNRSSERVDLFIVKIKLIGGRQTGVACV